MQMFKQTTRMMKTINHSPYLKTSIKLQYQPRNNIWGFGGKKKAPETEIQQPVVEEIKTTQTKPEILETSQPEIPVQTQNYVQDNISVVNENIEPVQQIQQAAETVSGFDIKINDPKLFNNSYVSEMDLGNIGSSLGPLNDYQHIDILSKISTLSPWTIYERLDVFSRDVLFWIAEPSGLDLGLGMSIAVCSLAIKMIFMPLMTVTQINALKMKLIEPEMKNFQSQTQNLSKRGDYAGVRVAQKTFSDLRKRYGIHNWVTVAGLSQIPFLITWFLSLRYVTSMPDKYPALRTEGLLWFPDLAEADPYFILPCISATLSYFNISMNPNLQNSSGNVFSKYMKYLKYAPFLTLPIVAFFPSGLNVYWAITAATHLMVALAVRSTFVRQKVFKIPEYLPGSILEKLNQKHTQKVIKTNIIDENSQKRQMAEQMAMSLTGKPIGNMQQNSQKIQENVAKQAAAKQQPSGEGVQVFTNRPTKKKKK